MKKGTHHPLVHASHIAEKIFQKASKIFYVTARVTSPWLEFNWLISDTDIDQPKALHLEESIPQIILLAILTKLCKAAISRVFYFNYSPAYGKIYLK